MVELLSHVWLIHVWKHKPVRPVGSQTSVFASVHLVAKEPGGWDGWLIYENTWYLKSQMSPSIFYVYVCSTHAHTHVYIYIVFIYDFSSNKPAKYHWNPMSAPAKVTLSPPFFEPSVGQIGLVKPWLESGSHLSVQSIQLKKPITPLLSKPCTTIICTFWCSKTTSNCKPKKTMTRSYWKPTKTTPLAMGGHTYTLLSYFLALFYLEISMAHGNIQLDMV